MMAEQDLPQIRMEDLSESETELAMLVEVPPFQTGCDGVLYIFAKTNEVAMRILDREYHADLKMATQEYEGAFTDIVNDNIYQIYIITEELNAMFALSYIAQLSWYFTAKQWQDLLLCISQYIS